MKTIEHNSSLLTKDENEKVFSMLGHKCQTLATTVVQLFSTDGPDGSDWIKRDAGVLCLVRDANRRSYFFRLFCLNRDQLIWEHEVYNSMEYNSPRPYLHTFEGEECIVAFNFANETEATYMKKVLLEKLKAKDEKRSERKKANSAMNAINVTLSKPSSVPPPPTVQNGQLFSNSQLSAINSNIPRISKRRTSGKITKADIGMPQEFRHVSHVGWDPDTGYDLSNVEDPTLQRFFNKVGISKSLLQNRKTRDFIYDFIDRHGGMDAVAEDLTAPKPFLPAQPPPVPTRVVQPQTSVTVRSVPPPPSKSPRPFTSLPPPPPPPIQTIPTRMQDFSPSKLSSVNTSSVPCNNAHPPPPPPPPPPLPPPPPIMQLSEKVQNLSVETPSEPTPVDPRAALMDAIRDGAKLKHVDTESKREDITTSNNNGSREELLSQIRQGVELKPFQQTTKAQAPQLDGLAGALARALAERSKAIYGDESSASENSDDYDDDDWEE